MSARGAIAVLLAAMLPRPAHAVDAPLTPEAVAAQVKDRLAEVTSCYERALSRKPWLVGRVVVSFTIDGSGGVARVELARAELDDVRVLACVGDRVATWRVERAPGAPADFSFPFIFAGGRGDPSVLVDGRPRPAVLPARCRKALECRTLGASLAYGRDAAPARSFEYFVAGCALDDGASCEGAAAALDAGHGVDRDRRRAFALAERACALGSHRACTTVAMTHALGVDGVAKKEPAKGAALLARACAAGEGAACLNLAERTRLGLGVPRDEAKAAELRRAALARAD